MDMLNLSLVKRRCSATAAVISFLVILVAAHLFLSPYYPASFGFFGVPELPADGLNPVFYRNAPWKAKIGQWLSLCDSINQTVPIQEVVRFKACKDDCGGQGVCNQELGECRCFHGFAGDGCSKKVEFECNLPTSREWPYGAWTVSMCPGFCDKTRAMCFCGEGTAYPNRPLNEACGFAMEPGPHGEIIPNLTRRDPHVFGTNASEPGWCNVVPEQAFASKAKRKMLCSCKYDCLWGDFCEIPTVCTCINQCSGHGHCRGGFCQCERGWYGIDCSIPSAQTAINEWPVWLKPATDAIPEKASENSSIEDLKVIVNKRRPLIYVYDLPPEFNSHLIEGRLYKYQCVNRFYSDKNRTMWTDLLYAAEISLHESILASPHRTMNAEEADYFYVPVMDACLITRANHAPHLAVDDKLRFRTYLALQWYKKAYDHIVEHFPYWNRSAGKDHIWTFFFDEGACYAPKEIWNSTMLVHWGNTNTKHNRSTTASLQDVWDSIPVEERGDHPCFDPVKDLVVPSWKLPDAYVLRKKFWTRPLKERKTLFYFNGNLGPAYDRPEPKYSMGIREKVAEEFGSTRNKDGKLGRQYAPDVMVMSRASPKYFDDLSRSIFCGVLPGNGWSGRMEDSILNGCIPVVIQDGIFLPYENFLNYDSFVIRIKEDEIPNLITILRSINESTIETMMKNVRAVRERFYHRDSMVLEAERQKRLFGYVEDWGTEVSKLGGDDVLTTVLQVLHYKLYNDPWRQRLQKTNRASGLPKKCIRQVS